MRKYLSILLLSIYLFSFSEFRQALKIPTLIEHFVKHTLTDSHFSVINFVEHHYLSGDIVDGDHEQDMKLPFKTKDSSELVSSVFVVGKFQNIDVEEAKIILPEKKSQFLYKKDFVTEFHYSIFQPPEVLM